mmetsp:Transcript_38708/g.124393  ORF Transcript_38708/g.124393 Transcript_38708/m.124393 type:complete len:285 (+) Transcript_38708:3723-4577(+)
MVLLRLCNLQALDQLPATFFDAGIGTSLLHFGLEVLVERLQSLGGGLDRGQEGVVDGLPRRQPLLLVAVQGGLQEVLAVLANPAWHLHLLDHDVLLAVEWEAACNHTEDDNAEGPRVNLQSIVQLVELRTPVRLRAALLLEALAYGQVADRAEVGEVDAALGMLEVLPVLQIVVALQIAVHNIVLVEPIHTLEHHLADVLNDRGVNHTLRLPMQLHALDHVAAPVNLQHDADKDLLVVHVVQLHHARVREFPQHLHFLRDLFQRCLHLVDHLHSVFLARALPLA